MFIQARHAERISIIHIKKEDVGMSQKNRWMSLCSIIFSLMMIFSFAGCAKKAVSGDPGTASDKVVTDESKVAAQSGAASSEAKAASTASSGATTVYVVKKGDSLWFIAKYKDIYGDDYLWPIIYNANKAQIKNPNRIYPGQKLIIPRDGFSMKDIEKARKKAGAKKPYTPPKGSTPPMK
ncbi:MAG TPA: peptidoglycan-binding protein [Syntrophus sp. (in: bacteria)]|jgi:LysM repeat protein|nr:peptidoglycan-binding protein [Syntrophus sp. (in: bacteria)]